MSALSAFLVRETRKLFGFCFILISRAECWFSMIYGWFPWLHVWLQPRAWNCGYRQDVDEVSVRGTCCDLQQKVWREWGVGGSIRFRAKDSVVTPRVLLDRCPEQRELSWMWEVFRRYIFQTQEDKGIIL